MVYADKDIRKILICYQSSNRLTQKELGDRLGFPQRTVSRWLNGETLPSTKQLYKILSVVQAEFVINI